MTKAYYTYRISITKDKNRVKVSKLGPNNEELGEPDGTFGYQAALKEQIDDLVKAAHGDLLADRDQVKALGEALFKALFDLRLGQDFVNFYEQTVRQEEQLLRIELNIDEQAMPEVVALPWEFMRAPADLYPNAFWLGTAPDLIFSRRRSQWQPAKPIKLEPDEKLRIALVISAPTNLGPVLYEDVQEMLEGLAEEQAEHIELLPVVETASAREIDKVLEQRPHIFHFIGHGRLFDEDGQATGQIALLNPLKKARWVDAEVFGELFVRHRPGIVFLQACESAAQNTSKAFVGVASRVVQQNIPVVVAMQYEVSNDTASIFAMEFYDRLVSEYPVVGARSRPVTGAQPVDGAVQNARRGIALEKAYTARDFATPVIFMRVQDGYLFERKLKVVDVSPPKSVQASSLLRRSLAQLNYVPQKIKFQRIAAKSQRMGAFLISGPANAGQHWLVSVLLERLLAHQSIQPINLTLGSGMFSDQTQLLWDDLAERLGLEFGASLTNISRAICEQQQVEDVVIVINNVAAQDKVFCQEILSEFWQPLVRQTQQGPRTDDNWLLLFMVDTQGVIAGQNFETVSITDVVWSPSHLVQLSALRERFGETELLPWLVLDDTMAALAAAKQKHGLASDDDLLQLLLAHTDNGVPLMFLKTVCRLCGQDWRQLERKWLKL